MNNFDLEDDDNDDNEEEENYDELTYGCSNKKFKQLNYLKMTKGSDVENDEHLNRSPIHSCLSRTSGRLGYYDDEHEYDEVEDESDSENKPNLKQKKKKLQVTESSRKSQKGQNSTFSKKMKNAKISQKMLHLKKKNLKKVEKTNKACEVENLIPLASTCKFLS